jgi:hypothetical protein
VQSTKATDVSSEGKILDGVRFLSRETCGSEEME